MQFSLDKAIPNSTGRGNVPRGDGVKQIDVMRPDEGLIEVRQSNELVRRGGMLRDRHSIRQ